MDIGDEFYFRFLVIRWPGDQYQLIFCNNWSDRITREIQAFMTLQMPKILKLRSIDRVERKILNLNTHGRRLSYDTCDSKSSSSIFFSGSQKETMTRYSFYRPLFVKLQVYETLRDITMPVFWSV